MARTVRVQKIAPAMYHHPRAWFKAGESAMNVSHRIRTRRPMARSGATAPRTDRPPRLYIPPATQTAADYLQDLAYLQITTTTADQLAAEFNTTQNTGGIQ
jgi:hypothetical protein